MKGFLFTLLTIFSLTSFIAHATQENCRTVHLNQTQNDTVITGIAPAEEAICFTLSGLTGQKVSLNLVQGHNVIFSIIDLIDAQEKYVFDAQKDTYKIIVGQLMRSINPEPFRLEVKIQK